MWSGVELREIRVFLTLAEELHFGRTAERLGITHSRVSQTIQTLEARVGAKLFDRTSRRVALTPLGEQLRSALGPVYRELERAFDDARDAATGIIGTVRIGMYSPLNGGPHMVRIVKTFQQRHPRCTIAFIDTGLERSQFDWLRSSAVDLLAMRLPVSEPDVSIGPILSTEERVLAVADDHPLATHDTISYEDVAGYAVSDARSLPREMMDAFIPPATPSGIMLRRVERQTVAEAFLSAAVGELVHPTVRSQLAQVPRGVTLIPIRDLPPSQTALLWLTANPSRKLAAFVRVATDVLSAGADNTAGPSTTRPPQALHVHPSTSTTTPRNAADTR
jgi:DNA-binding transcriptional LysR family regulator